MILHKNVPPTKNLNLLKEGHLMIKRQETKIKTFSVYHLKMLAYSYFYIVAKTCMNIVIASKYFT